MQPCGYIDAATSAGLDATFAALADPTRRAILARLISGEASVSELAQPFAMTQPAVSKHLKVLESAGLISRDRDAQRRPSRLEAKPLAEASQWLAGYRAFWETSFSRLDDLLVDLQSAAEKRRRPGAQEAIKETTMYYPSSFLYKSQEARDTARKSSMDRGMAAGCNRLEELLSSTLTEQMK